MKKLFYVLFMGALAITACKKEAAEEESTVDISMGTEQALDVYYSFINGEISSADRSGWDLEFSVPLRTATIRINEGAGVELYKVGDTTLWGSIDTSGIAGWEPLYNDDSDWMKGAFNLDADGNFNFGWAFYDHANTYNVIGLYVYVIKLSDGSYKKLFIRMRVGHTDTYVLRWADIDGSNQVDTTFSPAPYADTKHFIHYSLINREIVEIEPDKDTWDLLFTRYVATQDNSSGSDIHIPVMGVLMNKSHQGAKVTGISSADAHYSDSESGFSNQADIIGWDWKDISGTNPDPVVENMTYFIKLSGVGVYKMYFTEYSDEAEGSLTFRQIKIE
jgi:hypothetical protein